MDPNGQHILEAFPLILAFIVLVSVFKNFSLVKLTTVVLITLTTGVYMCAQLSWWFLHFYQGAVVMPWQIHAIWSVADTLIMLTFIQVLSGRA
jgi:hypothetical protein